MRLPRVFVKNQDGVAIIEFAIVGPALFLLLIGFIEFGLIFFVNSVLEGATNVGSRIGKTGFTTANTSREDYIRSQVVSLSGGFLDANSIQISILSYNSFANIGQPEPCISPPTAPCPGTPGVNFSDINGNGVFDIDQGATNAGGAGAVVLYTVTYPWRIFTPLMSGIIGTGGIYNISAVAAVRNEQF
jgi:hypothetical protein